MKKTIGESNKSEIIRECRVMKKDIDTIQENDITKKLLKSLTDEEIDYLSEKFFSDESDTIDDETLRIIAGQSAEYDENGNIIEFKGAWNKKNYPTDENGNIITWWE